jgi:hypothetical protein
MVGLDEVKEQINAEYDYFLVSALNSKSYSFNYTKQIGYFLKITYEGLSINIKMAPNKGHKQLDYQF